MSVALQAMWANLVKALLGNVGGIQGWVARIALQYGGQYLYDMLIEWERKMRRANEQAAAKKQYDSVQANPKSTAEERAKAYEDLINAGR